MQNYMLRILFLKPKSYLSTHTLTARDPKIRSAYIILNFSQVPFSPSINAYFCLTVLDHTYQGDDGEQDNASQSFLVHFANGLLGWMVQPRQQLSPASTEGGSEGLSYLAS